MEIVRKSAGHYQVNIYLTKYTIRQRSGRWKVFINDNLRGDSYVTFKDALDMIFDLLEMS